MIYSAAELGLGQTIPDHPGVAPGTAEPGDDAAAVLGLDVWCSTWP